MLLNCSNLCEWPLQWHQFYGSRSILFRKISEKTIMGVSYVLKNWNNWVQTQYLIQKCIKTKQRSSSKWMIMEFFISVVVYFNQLAYRAMKKCLLNIYCPLNLWATKWFSTLWEVSESYHLWLLHLKQQVMIWYFCSKSFCNDIPTDIIFAWSERMGLLTRTSIWSKLALYI